MELSAQIPEKNIHNNIEDPENMLEHIIFSERIPDIGAYNELRVRSGKDNGIDPKMADRAIHNSLYLVSAYDGDKLIGLGRVVGDGAVTFAVTDIMVDRAYQNHGVGDRIMDHIETYLDGVSDEHSFIMLIARIPSDHLYRRHRFEYLQEGYRTGMIRNQSHLKSKD